MRAPGVRLGQTEEEVGAWRQAHLPRHMERQRGTCSPLCSTPPTPCSPDPARRDQAGLLVPALVLVPVLVLVLEKDLLTGLAMRMADDPFNQVKKMIKDLKKIIVKLMEETNEEGEELKIQLMSSDCVMEN